MDRRHFLFTSGAVALVAGCAMPTDGGDIVSVAQGNSDFSTLVTAVQTAGLGDTLRGPGPLTVFAPTNAAFEALPAGVLDALLAEENRDLLTTVLTYHVSPGNYPASALAGQSGSLPTAAGPTLSVDGTGGSVTVNGVPVVTPDVMASNGVIHAISSVLLPPGVDVGSLIA